MHHALVFSTSKHSSGDGDAASWLADLVDDFRRDVVLVVVLHLVDELAS